MSIRFKNKEKNRSYEFNFWIIKEESLVSAKF